jgi:glycosyltransferase involved in cell wall biosynthesis
MEPLRVLGLTRYGPLGASSRMRFYQYLPWLEAEGLAVTMSPFFSDGSLQARYRRGKYTTREFCAAYFGRVLKLLRRRRFHLLWVEKEALPWWPASLELMLLSDVPYVLDYDDAVFHNYDMHRRPSVRRVFGGRLDRLMAGSRLVLAGNEYLANRARAAGAPAVTKLPTVVDVERYSLESEPISGHGGPIRIVWIGSPTTTEYLQLIASSLQVIARKYRFILRLIGAGSVDLPGVNVEHVKWSTDTEASLLGQCDIGIMPLRETPWELGKCGYKLVQYMAAGLPCVASAVGANMEIVRHGDSGFLAATSQDWVSALETLFLNHKLRREMGAEGRRIVEALYSVQVRGPALGKLIKELVR